MANFLEIDQSFTTLSSQTSSKVSKDRERVKVNLRSTEARKGMKQKSPVEQAVHQIRLGNAIKMQNGAYQVRISKYTDTDALSMKRMILFHEDVENVEFDWQDDRTITFIIKFVDSMTELLETPLKSVTETSEMSDEAFEAAVKENSVHWWDNQ